jgi:hypothetical protein
MFLRKGDNKMTNEEKVNVVNKFFDELREPIVSIIHTVPDEWTDEKIREFSLALVYIALLGKEKMVEKKFEGENG